jgi:hypothetical protein
MSWSPHTPWDYRVGVMITADNEAIAQLEWNCLKARTYATHELTLWSACRGRTRGTILQGEKLFYRVCRGEEQCTWGLGVSIMSDARYYIIFRAQRKEKWSWEELGAICNINRSLSHSFWKKLRPPSGGHYEEELGGRNSSLGGVEWGRWPTPSSTCQ